MSMVPLSEVCDITAGQSAPQDSDAFGREGQPFIRAGSLDALTNGGSENACEHLTEEKAQQYRMRLFPKDTIVFAKRGMSAKIGRVYRLKAPAYIVSHLAAVTPGKDVDPSYLQRWFERNPPSRLIPNEAYPSIRTSEIGALKIELPKKSEQKRIAAILDKADAIRRKRQQAIQLANEFLRSVFLDMFGDPVTNPKGWEVEKLGDIAKIQIGPFGTQLHKEGYIEGGVPLINPTHIVGNEIRPDNNLTISKDKYLELSEYHLKVGDIVMGRRGEMGRCTVITENENGWVCGTGSLYIRPNKTGVFSDYINRLISGSTIKAWLESESQGATLPNLNKKIVSNIKVPVPSDDTLERFSEIIIKIERIRDVITSCSNEPLFQSVSQRAFRGKL